MKLYYSNMMTFTLVVVMQFDRYTAGQCKRLSRPVKNKAPISVLDYVTTKHD